MDKSTENPGNDTVSTKRNKSIKRDEKTSTDGGINVGMMVKFRKSLRLPTRKNPPSPSEYRWGLYKICFQMKAEEYDPPTVGAHPAGPSPCCLLGMLSKLCLRWELKILQMVASSRHSQLSLTILAHLLIHLTARMVSVDSSTGHSPVHNLKKDLQWVVEEVKNCYPPEMDICNFYAREYHQTFSARLKQIADFDLDDKDFGVLLQWVKEFYPEILENPELASNINTEALGNLFPDELLKALEEQYLSKQQSNLMIYIGRVLDEAKKEWDQGKEPTRDDGCYASPVAYDVIQFINGIVTSAHKIVGDRHKAQEITSNLKDFMQRYQKFHKDIIRQNKRHSKAFIKANLSCVKQLRDFLVKHELFPEDVKKKCLQVLTEMKQSAHTYLLTPVHKILKPHYQKLGTSDWLKKKTFEKLLNSTEDELQELQGSSQSSYQELIGQLHQEVTVEYVRRLLKGEVKLNDSNQQQKAYETVKENAEKLHELFARMVRLDL
ncbi:tumor necrosis factor alpha-induced protein 2-like [Neolamprologus brichardi]|uniref:tumor necrosis factor alpha-induced protein 2-like n=1 Tax=Neolamprologus brichardi TaxID=32507 RepID=UPI001643D311|nr:tumor necrosis factor alpha-induced protein 2-like [Neolamprologus brichardi]